MNPTLVSPKIPPEILAKATPEPAGVAFRPVFTVLYPPAAISLAKKVVLALIAKPLQWITKTSDGTSVATRLAFLHGITVDDILGSIKKLIESGLPEDHPQVDELKKIRDSAREFKEKHSVLTFLTENYYEYSRQTDQGAETGVPFLNRQQPAWKAKKGYAWNLREQLNNFGLFSRLYQWLPTEGGKIIRFIPQEKLAKLFSKISQPILTWLGKTGLGTALKIGAKKVTGWLATRLGIEAGIVAAGTAAAPGVGTAIAVVISAVIEVAKKAWDKLKFFLYNLINKPENALKWMFLGGLAFVLLPAPFAFVGALPFAVGTLGLLAWGTTGAGGFLGGLANGIAGFFTSLTLIPASGAPVALLVVGTLGSLSLLTFFIVMTTAGAFILPVGPTEAVPGVPPPANLPTIAPPPGLDFRWPAGTPSSCSSNYGWRRLEDTCDYHEGIDIPASTGSPITAVAKGIVYDLNFNPGYGNYVVIKHDGLYSFYGHLLGFSIYKGDQVDGKTIIGYADSTGYVTGSHLHLGFSDCGEVPGCFNDGSHTPDPCNYLSCPVGCSYQDKTTGCPGL